MASDDAPIESGAEVFDESEVFIESPDDLDDELFIDPPRWPKAVGIISISLGSLNFCCGLVGGAGLIASAVFLPNAAQQMKGGFPPIMLKPPLTIYVSLVTGLIWALLLIITGVMTVSRKQIARTLHLVYAVGAVLLTVWAIAVTMSYQGEIAQWVHDNPSSDFAKSQQTGAAVGQMVGLAIQIVLGLGWPTFCLIWFGLAKHGKDADSWGAKELTA